jgi:hypothetical protein
MLLDAGPPVCSGGLSTETCSELATVLCTMETKLEGAPPVTWFACDDPLHQKGGAVRTLTRRMGSTTP